MPKEETTEKQKKKPEGKKQPQKRARKLNQDQLEELRRKLQRKYR